MEAMLPKPKPPSPIVRKKSTSQLSLQINLEPTKVSSGTAKLCPHCLQIGKKSVRIREYRRTVPLCFKDVDQSLDIHLPRISGHPFWRSNPYLEKWFATPEIFLESGTMKPNRSQIDPLSFPWCECWCIATCPRCDISERVRELDYVRPFCRARLRWLVLEDQFPSVRIFLFR